MDNTLALINTQSGGQFDFDGDQFPAGMATGTISANKVYLRLTRVSKPLTIGNMSTYIGAANGNVDLGYYSDANADGTYDLLAHTGSTADAGSNAKQKIALLAAITLVPGVNYWRAFITDSATVTIQRSTGNTWANVQPLSLISATVTFATAPGLPTTVSGLAVETSMPLVVGEA